MPAINPTKERVIDYLTSLITRVQQDKIKVVFIKSSQASPGYVIYLKVMVIEKSKDNL